MERSRPRRPVPTRVAAAAVLVLGVACTTAGCTQHDAGSASSPSATPSAGAGQAAVARSAPLRVEITHVAGTLTAPARRSLTQKVASTLTAYTEAAFLTGGYPRREFAGALGSFTAGVAPQARHDEALLTNAPLGPTTTAVRATRRTAYLSVLAPRSAVSGVTAAVDLRFAVERGSRPARTVRVKGRLLLTKVTAAGRAPVWKIFGYDLTRSTTPTRSGS